MAEITLTEIEAAIPRLSAPELEQLESRVRQLRAEREKTEQSKAGTDLGKHMGTLRLTIDPVEWQRKIRAEWE